MELIRVIEVIEKLSDITICRSCLGSGKQGDDSFGSGMSDYVTCDRCEGTGRIKLVIAKCEVEVPFNFSL